MTVYTTLSDTDGSLTDEDHIVRNDDVNTVDESTIPCKRHVRHKVWVVGFNFDKTGVRVLLVQDISGDIAPVGGSVLSKTLGLVRGQPVDLANLEASMCENANREAFEEIGLTDLFDVSANPLTTRHRFSWFDPDTPGYEYHCRVYYIDISRQMRELTPDHPEDMRACERHVMRESDASSDRQAHEVIGAKFYTLNEIWALKQNKETDRLWFPLSRLFDKPSCRRFFAEKLPRFRSTRDVSASWPTVPWESTKPNVRWVDAPKRWVTAPLCDSKDNQSWIQVPRRGISQPPSHRGWREI